MDKKPVQLTARQQDILADLASNLRGFVYSFLSDKEIDALTLKNSLEEWAMRFQVTAQELDTIYDIMHRTGANQ